MAGFWIGGDDATGINNYYGPNGKNVASIINGKLYVYDPQNFNASDPDVQSVVSQAQPQIASPLEVANVINEDAPGNGAGKGSMKEGLTSALTFIASMYGLGSLAGGLGGATGAEVAGSVGDWGGIPGAVEAGGASNAGLSTAINAGNAGQGALYGGPSYGVEGSMGLAPGGAAAGAAAGAGGLSPEIAQMLTKLGIPLATSALSGGAGAGGGGSGGTGSNLLSLLGPALGIGGGLSSLLGGGQVGTKNPVYNPTGLGQADNTLQQLLQAVYTQSADPQSALYNRTLQQSLDTGRAGQAARGLGNSPVGQQLENQQTNNFNMDWQNQQLQRSMAGIPGLQNYLQTGANAQVLGNQANLANANFNAGQQQKGVAGLSTGLNQLGTLANQPGSWLNTLFSGGGGGGGGGGTAPVGGSNDVNAYPTFSY